VRSLRVSPRSRPCVYELREQGTKAGMNLNDPANIIGHEGPHSQDWFERLAGFRETDYEATRGRFVLEGDRLRSLVNGRGYRIGTLELVSLQSLRERVRTGAGHRGRLKVRNVSGDVRLLHRQPEYAGALFQVASQFNLLEMVSPSVTPEQGVTRYEHDRTQGPACAMAAGAATIYRNYFVPVDGTRGQTKERQLDGLADLGAALGERLNRPVQALWTMRNGYALCTREGLDAIGELLRALGEEERDALRGLLRIGLHWDVEVTDVEPPEAPLVTQAFCSALPVACTDVPRDHWRPFARLVLEAAYEATLLAALLNARRGTSNLVLLTRLGGGVFGNDDQWIDAAMRRALSGMAEHALDVRLVSHGPPPASMLALEEAFG
jgi:hypothetical protein